MQSLIKIIIVFFNTPLIKCAMDPMGVTNVLSDENPYHGANGAPKENVKMVSDYLLVKNAAMGAAARM